MVCLYMRRRGKKRISWRRKNHLKNHVLSLSHCYYMLLLISNQKRCPWPTSSQVVTGSWNLTDQDAVDELVHLFELDERFGGDCQHF